MTADMENLRVVLVATRNPLNIGAVARAMSNFGVQQLRVVNPYEPAFREARSAVGAADLLARAVQYDDVGKAVADCGLVVGTTVAKRRDLQHRVQPLALAGRAIKKQMKTKPVALLFGSERFGLLNEEMSHCHWLMRIPTREEHGSMNLGQAVAVCLYELIRMPNRSSAKLSVGKSIDAPSSAEDVERFTQAFLHVLHDSGYIKPRAIAADEKLRRLVRRLALQGNDAEVLLGMIRQIAWKIKSHEKLEKK
jgi:TrmH family RNA methyltransferase